MTKVRICEDPIECKRIWEKVWPQKCFFDLWQVRDSFASSYKRQPFFIVAENKDTIEGVIALSWVDEENYFAHFPGETWNGKTWLEQNKILARTPQIYNELLDNIPGSTQLRYLTRESVPLDKSPVAVDEVGYLFYPGAYGFSFQSYLEEFSRKSIKKISRELAGLENYGVAYRYDHFEDIRWLLKTNLKSFQDASYFHDPRFLNSFEKLVACLHRKGMLRITTLLLGGTVAAVDVGAIWNRSFTVLAGATNPDFPGVAKMINFYHLEWSCLQQIEMVDFLCGDFGWKQRFHLTARPLYEMNIQQGLRTGLEAESLRLSISEK